jgi:hypothetical protein
MLCLAFNECPHPQNEKIERRVRSAGAGASRALSERVHVYRTNAVARAELRERCLVHTKVILFNNGVSNSEHSRLSS